MQKFLEMTFWIKNAQKWACPMSENPALLREYMDIRFANVLVKCGSYSQKRDCIHYSTTDIPICKKFGTELLDDFRNNWFKFGLESI